MINIEELKNDTQELNNRINELIKKYDGYVGLYGVTEVKEKWKLGLVVDRMAVEAKDLPLLEDL
jgi:hypothetical protein